MLEQLFTKLYTDSIVSTMQSLGLSSDEIVKTETASYISWKFSYRNCKIRIFYLLETQIWQVWKDEDLFYHSRKKWKTLVKLKKFPKLIKVIEDK